MTRIAGIPDIPVSSLLGDSGLNVAVPAAAITAVRSGQPQVGEWLMPIGAGTSTGLVPVTNVLILFPLDVAVAHTFVAIGVGVTQASAGGGAEVIRLGLYADDGTGSRPTGAAILDAGTFTPSSLTDAPITISQALPIGRVWMGVVSQGTKGSTVAQLMTAATSPISIPPTNLGNGSSPSFKTWAMSAVSGGLPTLSGISRQATAVPYGGLKA